MATPPQGGLLRAADGPTWVLFLAGACCIASITAMESVVALAGLVWVVRLALQRSPAPHPAPALLLMLLACWGVLSAVLSPDPGRAVVASGSMLLWIVVPMGTAILDRPRVERLRALLLLQAGLLGIWAVTEFFFLWDGDPLARVRGPFSHHMTLAGVLLQSTLLGLPGADLGALVGRRWGRLTGHAAVAAGLAGVAATMTRSALLAAACGLVVIGLTRAPRRHPRLELGAAVLLVFLVAGAVSLPWLGPWRGAATAASASVEDRFYLWQAGVKMVRERPLLGVGANRVRDVAADYLPPHHIRPGTPAHLHSALLTLAAERGLPAAALLVLLLAATGWRLQRQLSGAGVARGILRGAAASLAAFVVMGLFEDNFDDAEVVFVSLLIMAVAWSGLQRQDAGGPAAP